MTRLVRTWTISGALHVVVLLLADQHGTGGVDSSVALVSGLGAIVPAAALYDGRLAPWTRR